MAEQRTYTASWRVRTSVFGAGAVAQPGWRHRLAQWLRRQADHLDGRASLSVHCVTEPKLDGATHARAIRASADALDWALRVEAKHEAIEQVMRQAPPTLY